MMPRMCLEPPQGCIMLLYILCLSSNSSGFRSPFVGGQRASLVAQMVKNSGNLGSIPELGRSPAGEHGNPLQYSCLENPHGQRRRAGCSPWGCRVEQDGATKHKVPSKARVQALHLTCRHSNAGSPISCATLGLSFLIWKVGIMMAPPHRMVARKKRFN